MVSEENKIKKSKDSRGGEKIPGGQICKAVPERMERMPHILGFKTRLFKIIDVLNIHPHWLRKMVWII